VHGLGRGGEPAFVHHREEQAQPSKVHMPILWTRRTTLVRQKDSLDNALHANE
jgi:hypothetical protein